MANRDEAIEAVLTALVATAGAADGESSHSTRAAAATRDLAEAYAWLRFPNQPHGGNSGADSGGS